MTTWDVYRDKDGNPVTITREQCAAILHAAHVWAEVCDAAEYSGREAVREIVDAVSGAMVSKSCLLGRMLYDGRPPTDERPPVIAAAPAYHLVDPDLCPTCGGERKGPPRKLAGSIDDRNADWYWRMHETSFGQAWKDGERVEVPRGKVRLTVQCAERWHYE